jgi:hypothetical protein
MSPRAPIPAVIRTGRLFAPFLGGPSGPVRITRITRLMTMSDTPIYDKVCVALDVYPTLRDRIMIRPYTEPYMTFGKTSWDLAEEAERGYDPAKMKERPSGHSTR